MNNKKTGMENISKSNLIDKLVTKFIKGGADKSDDALLMCCTANCKWQPTDGGGIRLLTAYEAKMKAAQVGEFSLKAK
jgi:hypothetical protein